MLALIALVLGTAEAQDSKEVTSAVKEIIVYSDDFARWDDTRWYIQTEMILPVPVAFARDFNWSFASYAFQIRSIVDCKQTNRMSKKRIEVDCSIEDIGILASTQRRQKGDQDRKIVQAVLDEVDSKMTGLKVQMQTDFKGGLLNMDIEGLTTSNIRQRAIQETIRQILMRVFAGFHLRIPDHAQRDGKYNEKGSQIMQMPSTTASQGSSIITHNVAVRPDGLQIVQSRGKGTTRITMPVLRPQGGSSAAAGPPLAGGGGGGNPGVTDGSNQTTEEIEGPVLISLTGRQQVELEANFALNMNGVAVFEKKTGIMLERIWLVQGTPSASSGGAGNRVGNYHTVGRLKKLVKDERIDVGPSQQVSVPTQSTEGLPDWQALEEFE